MTENLAARHLNTMEIESKLCMPTYWFWFNSYAKIDNLCDNSLSQLCLLWHEKENSIALLELTYVESLDQVSTVQQLSKR